MNEQFLCPISKEIMTDPVIDKEGNTFERKNIERWLREHGTSPITRTPMNISDLVTNRTLRDLLDSLTQSPSSNQTSNRVTTSTFTQLPDPSITVFAKKIEDVTRVMVSISCPEVSSRSPVVVCCVIDVSYSMSSPASLGSGGNESYGLCILDIVKHAVHTIIKSLGDGDQLAIVSFSRESEIVLPLTNMDSAGHSLAVTTLNQLEPDKNTNLWAGLETGLDVLKGTTGGLGSVLLFTDGEPNVIPPRGHLPMLERYKEKCGGELPGRVSTFGFGYALDSKLLNDLAVQGNGQYAFIPDSGFTGTIFVHAIANLMTIAGRNCVLSIDAGEGTVSISDVVGHLATGDKFIDIQVGALHFGQPVSVVFDIHNAALPLFFAKLRLIRPGNVTWETNIEIAQAIESNEIEVEYYRLLFVQECLKAIENASNGNFVVAEQIISQFVAKMPPSVATSLEKLLVDINGQVREAFRPDYFMKWGRHYLPSLLFAHLHQTCNNFKDPGVQGYGGTLFRKLRDEADDLFCKLPPPTPTMSGQNITINNSTQAAPISMASWNNQNNVCFDGGCKILMASGEMIRLDEIKKGDMVACDDGTAAEIECVVQSKSEGSITLVKINQLILTPYHPIFVDQRWIFPIDYGKVIQTNYCTLYNILISGGKSVLVEGIVCATLAHGLQGPVIFHSFFGTNMVRKELMRMNGWESGHVNIAGVVRDEKNGLVVGLFQKEL